MGRKKAHQSQQQTASSKRASGVDGGAHTVSSAGGPPAAENGHQTNRKPHEEAEVEKNPPKSGVPKTTKTTASSAAPQKPTGPENSKVKGMASPAVDANNTDAISSLCSNLVELCSQQMPETSAQLWQHYCQISDVLLQIQDKQSEAAGLGLNAGLKGLDLEFSPSSKSAYSRRRADALPDFIAWCDSVRVERFGVDIAEFGDFGFGLTATADLEKEKVILHVPRRSMITSELAERSELKEAVKSDPVLKGMSNVALAVFLLSERIKGADSNWRAYIDILPRTYNTVLYFTRPDFEIIRHSRAFELAITMYRSIARQYGYFYQLIANPNSYFARSVLNARNFTYDAYRWAVSAVTTRLNMIPCDDGSSWAPQIPALIPFWDMANHTEGAISTDYDTGGRRGVCFAIQDYRAGGQVCIFYGLRNNAQFVVHNGFFFDGNSVDSTPIRLGLGRSDRLYAARSATLARHGVAPVDSYDIACEPPHFPRSMLSFARVFNATEPELRQIDARLDAESPPDASSETANASASAGDASTAAAAAGGGLIKPVSQENEIKVWTFLKNRLQLMLRSYPKSRDEYALDLAFASGAGGCKSQHQNQLLEEEKQSIQKHPQKQTGGSPEDRSSKKAEKMGTDDASASDACLTANQRLAVKLLIAEMTILNKAMVYADRMAAELQQI